MGIRVVLVGCGNMGFAMLAGWLRAGSLAPAEVLAVEPSPDLRARAASLGVEVAGHEAEIPGSIAPELVILAVKPQVIREVAAAYRRFGENGAAFLSIAAGTTVASLQSALGEGVPVLRCMPNTPAAIGKGMLVTYATPLVRSETRAFVGRLLSASGEVAEVDDEGLMDAVTAVSGSGPAYLFHFIECLTAAAESAGLPPETARRSALQTVYGAASLAAQSGEDPATLRRQVTSPNGTTAAALEVLMGEDRLKTLVTQAVEAARRRSVELGR